MKNSLRVFLSELIDYAGLFPPAKLPLDEAIRNYASYRSCDDSWMMSRFIIPVAKLRDLESYGLELFSQNPPFVFSVLSRGGDHPELFLKNLKEDLQEIQNFHNRHQGRTCVDRLEIRLPQPFIEVSTKDDIVSFFQDVERVITQSTKEEMIPFFEMTFADNWQGTCNKVIRALVGQKGGFKLRCGGVEAHMFPSPEMVSQVIYSCAQSKVPLKCTAGLHHPVRHHNDSVKTKMYGFFNIFVAGIMACQHQLSFEEIEKVVVDENPENFVFQDAMISWMDYEVDLDQAKQARKHFITSFGSCSFDEPREDLQTLGHKEALKQ